MPIQKQSLNNFLPDGFETLNQEGYKENFSEDKIKTGYEKDLKDRVSGPNFNNLIDVVGKNTNTLNSYVEYLNGMPINNVPTVNEFNQLDYTNLDDKLTKKQITNCLLEVPQRIKLELNNGTLTLKAGSEVIVPNGFEADGITPKFDYVTIANDISKSGNVNPHCIMFYDTSFNMFNHFNKDVAFSGDTAPTTFINNYAFWYDTANNVIKRTSDGGVTWISGMSLPVCIVSSVDSSINSAILTIDQIFNGMGYIGSTVWVDKGVKGLIPNGRNEDGTLNNIEYEFKNIAIIDFSTVGATYQQAEMWYSPDINKVFLSNFYYEQENTPILDTTHALWFNPTENIVKITTNKGENWIQERRIFLGLLSTDKIVKNLITSVTFSKTFKAVNYYDKPMVSGWGMPSGKSIDLTLGASGAAYTAPANGFFALFKSATAQNQYMVINVIGCWNANSPKSNGSGDSYAVWTPVKKGQKVTITYSLGGSVTYFRFVYAEGEI